MCSKKMVYKDFFENVEINIGHYSAIISERNENKLCFSKTQSFLASLIFGCLKRFRFNKS